MALLRATPVFADFSMPTFPFSPLFFLGADKERFKFAKEAIELRKRTRQNGGAVETVVLAFGGNSPGGSAVHVTRKTRKRQLFKVG